MVGLCKVPLLARHLSALYTVRNPDAEALRIPQQSPLGSFSRSEALLFDGNSNRLLGSAPLKPRFGRKD